jgi:hypothetical protein
MKFLTIEAPPGVDVEKLRWDPKFQVENWR